jgi:disulfide bond formation protein DsbB
MSVYGRILLAGLGSLVLVLGALGFQFLGDLAPCPMCIWQRWPHVAASAIAIVALTLLWRLRRPISALGFVAMGISAGLGAFHVGVEQKWWSGPGTCSGLNPSGLSSGDLLNQIVTAELVPCDEIAWEFLGISMAGWNALISVGLALLWLFAALPKRTSRHVMPG